MTFCGQQEELSAQVGFSSLLLSGAPFVSRNTAICNGREGGRERGGERGGERERERERERD